MTRLILLIFICCTSLSIQAQVTPSAYAPGTCRIEGKVIRICKANKNDTGTLCLTYPCDAMIRITKVLGCGSSVTSPLNKNSMIKVHFEYTLHNTRKLFPNMKTHYPGLRKRSCFVADIAQVMKMGAGSSFVIYGYELK